MIGIIDRFEENFAVIELSNGSMINISKKRIPFQAKEGDVVIIEGSKIIIDEKATQKRKSEIQELTKDIWN